MCAIYHSFFSHGVNLVSLLHVFVSFRQSLKELQRSNETLERQYQHSEAQFKQIKQQVVALKNKATQMADIMNDEDLKDKLEDLSTEIGTLEGQIEDADYNIRNIQDNPQVLILYAAQKKKLRDFSDQFENLKDFKGAKRSELIACMEPYEAALTNITQKVNAKFMNYMKELGCAGRLQQDIRVVEYNHVCFIPPNQYYTLILFRQVKSVFARVNMKGVRIFTISKTGE